jgi:hypothetical protein
MKTKLNLLARAVEPNGPWTDLSALLRGGWCAALGEGEHISGLTRV